MLSVTNISKSFHYKPVLKNIGFSLSPGETVALIGKNGAGKSSIIDAITFSLFGQHTRKSNKSLIKRRSNQGFTKIGFSINGRQYQAVRKIDNKGSLSAKFSEIIGDERIELAAGERKQFGESMTHEIEKTIGLDFEKLKKTLLNISREILLLMIFIYT